jgi:hypothetical protein
MAAMFRIGICTLIAASDSRSVLDQLFDMAQAMRAVRRDQERQWSWPVAIEAEVNLEGQMKCTLSIQVSGATSPSPFLWRASALSPS